MYWSRHGAYIVLLRFRSKCMMNFPTHPTLDRCKHQNACVNVACSSQSSNHEQKSFTEEGSKLAGQAANGMQHVLGRSRECSCSRYLLVILFSEVIIPHVASGRARERDCSSQLLAFDISRSLLSSPSIISILNGQCYKGRISHKQHGLFWK